jgi:hypothetical protein
MNGAVTNDDYQGGLMMESLLSDNGGLRFGAMLEAMMGAMTGYMIGCYHCVGDQ